MNPWRYDKGRLALVLLVWLQWGHGVEPVEIVAASTTSTSTSMGFNGATGLNPWRSPRAWNARARVCALQWGHGVEPVEICPLSQRLVIVRLLQWGHGVEPVEMWGDGCDAAMAFAASMGPRG